MTTPENLAAAIARDIQPEPGGGGFSLYGPGGYGSPRQQFTTREAAEAECLARAELAVAYIERNARIEAKEAAREVEFDAAFAPYGETLAPLAWGKAKAHLARMVLFRGSLASWLVIARQLISEGRTVEIREGKPALVAADGCYLLVSKTAADFARFLVASRQ